jgi:hypothetical protein
MSSENAKLVNSAISLFVLGYCLMVFMGKIPLKKRSHFLEKYKSWLIAGTILSMCYPFYEILHILFLKK